MAKKTLIFTVCDRCGAEEKQPHVPTRGGRHGLKFTTPHGGDFFVGGIDLCVDCKGDLERFMMNMLPFSVDTDEPAKASAKK